ncbi:MAG: alkane 1-monooxygenase, partial [Porticoccaceae bacterium]
MNHPSKGEITYTDKKRYLWLMSMIWPLMPLGAIYL